MTVNPLANKDFPKQDKQGKQGKQDKQDSSAVTPVSPGPLSIRMQGAYLKLWVSAFIGTGDKPTVREVRIHPLTFPHNRVPDLTTMPCTIADQLLRAIAHYQEDHQQDIEGEVMDEFIYHSMLPALKSFCQNVRPRYNPAATMSFWLPFHDALLSLRSVALSVDITEEQLEVTNTAPVLLLSICI